MDWQLWYWTWIEELCYSYSSTLSLLAGKERPCIHSTCHPSANVRSVSSFFIWSAQKMSSGISFIYFSPWHKCLKRKLWPSFCWIHNSRVIMPHFFPVVQNATGLRLGTWIGTSPCPRHKGQKKSLLQNLKGTSCPRPAATPGSVARELRLWKHHNKNYDKSWLKLASITIELLTISAIS